MALSTFIYVFLCRHVFIILGTNQGVELLSHIVTLTFWGTPKMFSKVAALFYIPTNSVKGFLFIYFLFCFLCFSCGIYEDHKHLLLYSFSKGFIVLGLNLVNPCSVNFYLSCKQGLNYRFLFFQYHFLKKLLFVPHCIIFSTHHKDQLSMNVRDYFWTLNYIPLICMSMLLPSSYRLGYHSFIL